MVELSRSIRIGVAGWDYPDWNGIVYPPSTGAGFDRLAFISRFVDTVEINSSFYRPVAPQVAESWLRRTAEREGFDFTAKSHRSWTHDPMADPREVVGPTLDGLRPLRAAGRLGALLIQFPQSFHRNATNYERLSRLADRAAGWPLVVELRHRSWDDDEAGAWLARRALGWCLVDQPRVGPDTSRGLPRVTAPLAYARLHGRNAANWFRPGAGRDARYDYRYSGAELRGLAGQLRTMSEASAQLYVIQNNHFRGQALANALQLRHLIDGERPEAPADLVAHYPDLAEDVRLDQQRLF